MLIATWLHGMINVAGNLFFAGMDPGWLSWLMPLGYGLAAACVVVGVVIQRQRQQPALVS